MSTNYIRIFFFIVTLHSITGNLVVTDAKFIVSRDVGFNLFTRDNRNETQAIKNGDFMSLVNSNFRLEKPIKIVVHGWENYSHYPDLVNAFLDSDDMNVIMVDWEKGTLGTEPDVIGNVPIVGKYIGKFIDWIVYLGACYDKVHLIGTSVGSHVVGWAGRSCKYGRVAYITAGDPPKRNRDDNPDLPNGGENFPNHINRYDAKYVEIIHTNYLYGMHFPFGTADFYPNGGFFMPGCPNSLCSHAIAFQYFIDSVDHKGFKAIKCKNYQEILSGACANLDTSYLGGCQPKPISGVYYLLTNEKRPFYKG